MKFLSWLSTKIDALNRSIGLIVRWVALLLVIVVFLDTSLRYLANVSYVFTQELEWHLFSFIYLIGAGYTLLQDGHVRVDIFYQHMNDTKRSWVNFLGTIFFLLPGCMLVIITSLPWVYNSFVIYEGSPDPGGIPLRFLLKACVPIGFLLILLQGISLGSNSLFTILGRQKKRGV
jgi:TRAP-type mannitol/chloroaromatic compound transport system permease small subunit